MGVILPGMSIVDTVYEQLCRCRGDGLLHDGDVVCITRRKNLPGDSIEKERTTPRRMEDVLASLAGLVSGSADAGTPVVLIKRF